MRRLTRVMVMAVLTAVTVRGSAAQVPESATTAADPNTRLRATVTAAVEEFDASHWPEATSRARAILAQLKAGKAAHHSLRGHLLRLLAKCHQTDPSDAVAAYDAALSAGLRDAEVLDGKGQALRQLDREADAIACFDESLALRPDHADTLRPRGLAYMAIYENDKALADLKKAARLDPRDPRHRIALASMQRRLGDVPAAAATLQQAITLDEAKGYLHTSLANSNRGLIVPDSETQTFEQKIVKFTPIRDPLMSAVIRYYGGN